MIAAALASLAIIGLGVGSFLAVCIHRMPGGESVVSPRSRCPSCRIAIRWYDNVPVLSYAVLGGRCRDCRAPISLRYPIVEIATAVAFVLQGWVHGSDPPLLVARLTLTAILIVLFGTDFETHRLPNVLTLPGIVVGLLFSSFLPPGITDSVLGVVLGGGLLFAIRSGWKRATGVEGMGLGDVKMLAMIGAFLGWRLVILVLFLSSVAGAVVGLTLIVVQGRSLQTRLPFGSPLALAAYTASLVGDSLVAWYLRSLQ